MDARRVLTTHFMIRIIFVVAATVGLANCTEEDGMSTQFTIEGDVQITADQNFIREKNHLVEHSTTLKPEIHRMEPYPVTRQLEMLDYVESSQSQAPDAVQEGAWTSGTLLALLLPLLVGLGVLELSLFHAASCYVIGTIKSEPERWRRWRLTAAAALGAAWAAQVALMAGLLLVSVRMRAAVRDGSFAQAASFSHFYPDIDKYPLHYIIYVTPVVIICYWVLLTVMGRLEELKRRKEEQQKEMTVKEKLDISLLQSSEV